jgi:hypothetical protein
VRRNQDPSLKRHLGSTDDNQESCIAAAASYSRAEQRHKNSSRSTSRRRAATRTGIHQDNSKSPSRSPPRSPPRNNCNQQRSSRSPHRNSDRWIDPPVDMPPHTPVKHLSYDISLTGRTSDVRSSITLSSFDDSTIRSDRKSFSSGESSRRRSSCV